MLEYEYGSEEMKALIGQSKFKDMPYFAKATSGRVGLQGDHGEFGTRIFEFEKL